MIRSLNINHSYTSLVKESLLDKGLCEVRRVSPTSVCHPSRATESQPESRSHKVRGVMLYLPGSTVLDREDRREERFQEREVHKWVGWALCE